MATTVTQFDNKLKHPVIAGDTRYIIPNPSPLNFRSFDFTGWLRGLSSVSGDRFTAATFDGTQVFLVANKTHFDTKVATATGVEVA
jgi:hypothetical protein